jgi:hypothetical protein
VQKIWQFKNLLYLCILNDKDMTTTNTTTPLIKVIEGPMAGDVFYGTLKTRVKDKVIEVIVSNHLKDLDKKYEFRIASKCQAGFISIHDYKEIPANIIRGYGKNKLVNIQVKSEYGNWMDVFTVKGNKWNSIDKGFLEVLTVATMRESFPEMCDFEIWKLVGAKTWADKSFINNIT